MLTATVSAGFFFFRFLSLCVSLWENVILETPFVMGTFTEAHLSTLPGLSICAHGRFVSVILLHLHKVGMKLYGCVVESKLRSSLKMGMV